MTTRISTPAPTREGSFIMKYTFEGWGTSNSWYSFVGYKSGDQITVTNNITLYAVRKRGFGW